MATPNLNLQARVITRELVQTRRELERQRSSDAGVFAAKVKAEEALRIAVRGEDEARRRSIHKFHTDTKTRRLHLFVSFNRSPPVLR